MIEIRNLTKHFGNLTAVKDVSFSARKGEVLGFLGPNGAGKSTTMKMVTGFLTPSSGTAMVDGFDVQKDPLQVKSRIGYLPEGAPLYGDMTPLSMLKFVAEVRGIPAGERNGRIADVVGKVHIEGVLDQRIDTLSKGFKRRVGLAQALVHDPEVLILDEPTDGLDPNQKHDVRQLIREMAQEKCIVLSTHILEEVPAVCTRAILIADGALKFDGTPLEMQLMSRRHNAVALTVRAGGGHDIAALSRIEGVDAVDQVDASNGFESFLLYPKDDVAILAPLSRVAHENNWEVEHLSVEKGRLDEVFRQITSTGA
jgi:ABC-2 type transport system ATP-binding protein